MSWRAWHGDETFDVYKIVIFVALGSRLILYLWRLIMYIQSFKDAPLLSCKNISTET